MEASVFSTPLDARENINTDKLGPGKEYACIVVRFQKSARPRETMGGPNKRWSPPYLCGVNYTKPNQT